MNVLSARVAIRERGLLDVLDLTVRFIASHLRVYAVIGAWVVLPAIVASVLASSGGWALAWCFALALASLASAPFTALAARLVFEAEVRPRDVLGASLGALPRLVVARFLQAMLLSVAFTMLFLPAVWILSLYLFLGEVVVLERASVGTALTRAPRIVSTASGDGLSAALLLSFLHVLFVVLGDAGGRAMLDLGLQVKPPESMWAVGGNALAMIGFWLFVPFGATARFFLYLNYRTRSEGWDVQTRFAALAIRFAAAAGVLAALVGALAPGTAHAAAAADPRRAAGDVTTALAAGDYAFCKSPPPPLLLSGNALALCPLAAEVPDCEPLKKACDAALKADAPPPRRVPWLESIARFLAPLLWVLVGAVVLGGVVAVAYAVIMAILRARRDRAVADALPLAESAAAVVQPEEALPQVTDAELLLRRADEAARGGDAERALALYLAASLRALDARGAVRITKDRTNGEYVRGCADGAARGPLREIVREVDRVQFGREAPSAEGVARAASRAVSLVRGVTAALTAIALILGLGACGGAGRLKKGADPAGVDLLIDLLGRQGFDAKRLGSSLASLPMPTDEAPAPAIVVDTETTALDEDSGEHLFAWVKQGGVLVLLGHPHAWPESLAVKGREASGVDVLVDGPPPGGDEEDEDEDEDEAEDVAAAPAPPPPSFPARLAAKSALEAPGDARPIAHVKDHDPETYAFLRTVEKGRVLGVASRDLFTNLGLARPGNAAALIALILHLDVHAWRIAAPEDGISPPSNPIAALHRAGLGLPLWHALAACALLFVAAGVRMRRPLQRPPVERRAYAEHVEATGAFYARGRLAGHALAGYARWADERVRARMPRGATDVPAFLAARSGRPVGRVADVWSRAMEARAATDPKGRNDDLALLKELSETLAAASI